MPSTKNLPYSLHLLIRFITYSSSWNYTLPFVNYTNFFLPWIGFLYFIQCNSLKKFIILFYSSLLGFFLELGTEKKKKTQWNNRKRPASMIASSHGDIKFSKILRVKKTIHVFSASHSSHSEYNNWITDILPCIQHNMLSCRLQYFLWICAIYKQLFLNLVNGLQHLSNWK